VGPTSQKRQTGLLFGGPVSWEVEVLGTLSIPSASCARGRPLTGSGGSSPPESVKDQTGPVDGEHNQPLRVRNGKTKPAASHEAAGFRLSDPDGTLIEPRALWEAARAARPLYLMRHLLPA
jgi:hypothetical protein